MRVLFFSNFYDAEDGFIESDYDLPGSEFWDTYAHWQVFAGISPADVTTRGICNHFKG